MARKSKIGKPAKVESIFDNPLIHDWVNYISFTSNGFILFSEKEPKIDANGRVAPFGPKDRYSYISKRALNIDDSQVYVRNK